ncbi:hypothetical protein ACHAXN_006575 [Cyclotella atomus]
MMLVDVDLLTPAQIQTYLNDGVLVVPLLSAVELQEAQCGLVDTLKEEYGVDVGDLEGTGRGLMAASSTNGAGGVLDIFYPQWKMKIATNEKLFCMSCQLWKEAYCHDGEKLEDMLPGTEQDADNSFKWHPYGSFDCNRGHLYIDRIGFRLPSKIAEQIGEEVVKEQPSEAGKKYRSRPIQRSLTPHFDCCPETYHDIANKSKWRPIQCFVSLTDNLHPNTGGFEAALGFHREFRSWTQNGRRNKVQSSQQSPHPRPCVGEYTHINPSHDREIMYRVQHVPVEAGCAVFWDNRIPHGNAYRNYPIDCNPDILNKVDCSDLTVLLQRSGARAVVYCSFLPDVDINRSFVEKQLVDWKLGRAPRVGDRWIKKDETEDGDKTDAVASGNTVDSLSDLGRKLLGLDEWP